MRLQSSSILLLAVLGAIADGGATPAAAMPPQDAPALFAAAPPGSQARATLPAARRSRAASLDRSTFPDGQRDDRRRVPRAIELNLFDGVSHVADFERLDRTTAGLVWVGRVRGEPLSTVTLASAGDAVAGSVVMPGAAYDIRCVGDDRCEIAEIDTLRLPREAEPLVPGPAARLAEAAARAGSLRAHADAALPAGAPRADPAPDAGPAPEGDPIPSPDEGSPTIDVLVLYTAAARTAAGGAPAIAALIDLGISEANTSYANSAIPQRIRLVRAEEVDYAEHNSLSTDLYNLTNHDGTSPRSTPVGDAAALLRNIHGADHVVLVTAPPAPSSCGLAWMLTEADTGEAPFAFSVVDRGCISSNKSIAHELGHNMGARHDWYVDNGTTPFTYSHGFVNTAARWRTMMAYNDLCAAKLLSCTRLLFWSNPAITYNGAPMGIPAGTKSDCAQGNVNDVSCDADDHRALNETAGIVAAYRSGWRRAASDFTPDLRSDILWRHGAQGDIWVWGMNGALKESESFVRTVADSAWQIRSLGDQTGDGRADLLWRHTTSGELYLWAMGRSAPAVETYVGTVDPAYDIAGTGDFDGDGKSDVLWRRAGTGEIWIWLMNGASPATEAFVDAVSAAYAVERVADVNGDRKADIVWRNPSTGEVWVWLMNGAGRESQAWVATVPDTNYAIAAAADFTGDGKADLLWRHAARGDAWLWTMNGPVRSAEAYIGTVADADYHIVSAGDYNADEQADILWWNSASGAVWVWLMDGAVKAGEALVGVVPDTGYRIVR